MSDVLERFEAKISPEPNSGCWIWTAGTRKTPSKSYIQPWFCMDRKATSGARAAWRLYRGDIPNGAHVLHTCHNCLCVNPDHLYLGDHNKNMEDLKASGRGRGSNGAIDASTVRAIKRAKSKAKSAASVAKSFNVHQQTVYRIWSGKRWAEL